MKIIEAIEKVDALKPNDYSREDKIGWLSTLDTTVKNEIIDTHEGAENVIFSGYNSDTSPDTELLVPTPHDVMYLRWLEAQIDYHNGEIGRYSNSMTMFNSAYSAYAREYNRKHMPLSPNTIYVFRVEKYEKDPTTQRENIVDAKDIYGRSLKEALANNKLNEEEWIMVSKVCTNRGFKYF